MEKNENGKKLIVKKRKLQHRKAKIESGGQQFFVSFPINMIRDMGITEDERDIEITYNPILKEIKIKKDANKEWYHENHEFCKS